MSTGMDKPGVGAPAPLDPVVSDAREKAPRTVAESAARGGSLKRASTLLLAAVAVFFVVLFIFIIQMIFHET